MGTIIHYAVTCDICGTETAEGDTMVPEGWRSLTVGPATSYVVGPKCAAEGITLTLDDQGGWSARAAT